MNTADVDITLQYLLIEFTERHGSQRNFLNERNISCGQALKFPQSSRDVGRSEECIDGISSVVFRGKTFQSLEVFVNTHSDAPGQTL